jgi:hypothetical protein
VAFSEMGVANMRKLLLTTVFLLLAAGSPMLAQTGTGSSSDKQQPWPAPVGHRQPRADQVPSEKNLNDPNSSANREDAALDKKIKSICRGC